MTIEPGRSRFAAAVTFAFLLVAGLGIARHEMWRDEMYAWTFAADSRTPAELLHNLRYEGHPPLWHLLLFATSRLTRRPEAMQVLNLFLAAAAIWLFARFAPFSRRVRALFAFGYFPLYEYGIISRNYAIGLLFLVALCALRAARPRAWIPLGLLLAGLALSNAYAWLLSAVLAAMLLFEGVRDPEARKTAAAQPWKPLLAALALAAAASAAAFLMIPAQGGFYKMQLKPRWSPGIAVVTLATVAHADLPLPDTGSYSAWNSSILWRLSYGTMALISLALVGGAAVLLRRTPAVLLAYLGGTAAILAFTYAEYFGSLRHHGHHFLLLVACFWLACSASQSGDESGRRRELLLTGLLLIHLAAAAVLYSLDLAFPFSESKAAADFLRQNGLANAPILATQDHLVGPVGGYLGRPLYFLESRRLGRFVLWDQQWLQPLTPGEHCRRLREWLAQCGGSTVVVSTRPPLSCGPDLQSAVLADLRQSIVPDERYFILVVSSRPHVER
jgi:hypothetical protein